MVIKSDPDANSKVTATLQIDRPDRVPGREDDAEGKSHTGITVWELHITGHDATWFGATHFDFPMRYVKDIFRPDARFHLLTPDSETHSHDKTGLIVIHDAAGRSIGEAQFAFDGPSWPLESGLFDNVLKGPICWR